MAPNALIIVPAYNEEASLPAVLDELRTACPQHDVLVVNDGSGDQTAALARKAGIAVVDLPFNLGIGGAMQTGFRYALRYGYEAAVQFDADGQHDSGSIDALLAAVDGGLDLVIGNRFHAQESKQYAVGHTRTAGMAVLRTLATAFTGQKIQDATSGFRAFSTKMIEYFALNYPVEYLDSVESLLLAQFAGFKVGEVEVEMRDRAGGKPSQQSLRLIYHFVRLLIVILSARPRRVVSQ